MPSKTLVALATIFTIATHAAAPARAQIPNLTPRPPAKSAMAGPTSPAQPTQPSAGSLAPPSAPTKPSPQKCTSPPNEPCPATAASCATQEWCCTDSKGTHCAVVRTSTPTACLPGYYGSNCLAVCSSCSSHGTCSSGITGTGACTCNSGYTGQSCNAPAARGGTRILTAPNRKLPQ
jgi:hypothetical protein